MTAGPARRVAVWRDDWLPASETFIRDQLAALRRWEPVKVAVRRQPSPLVEPDLASLGDGGSRLSLAVRRRAPLPMRRRALRFAGLEARLRAEGVELVHAHFGTGAANAALVSDRLEVPLVVTCHGMDVTSRLDRSPGGRLYAPGLARTFARADALVGVSRFICDCMLAAGADPARLHRLPVGVPIVPVEAGPAERSGICFVGRLVEVKHVGDLLEAVAGLPAPYRDTPVTVVGDGPQRAQLEADARRRRLRVTFTGRRTSAEVRSILRRHRLFVGPSRTTAHGDAEGLGLVFLEAGLQELPAVAYRHGGVPEAVVDGRTGLLAEEGDVAGLAERIGRLLADPARAEAMGRAARARVAADFAVDRCTAALEDLYDRVAPVTAGAPTRR